MTLLDFKTDGVGDTYSKKYDAYLNDDIPAIDTLGQLEKNYESAFDEEPDKQDLLNALTFVRLFLAEVAETCPGSNKARACMELSYLIEEDDAIETCKRISEYRKV